MPQKVRLLICGLFACLMAASGARAQLMLPGAAPAKPEGAKVAPVRHRSPAPSAKETEGRLKAARLGAASGVESVAGRALLLNGKSGLMQISGDDKTAILDKLELSGETVSDPSQRCVVNIVGEKPILATSAGRPDGLMRFQADIPACPIAFDVLDGAVLVPAQITACVFKAADCRTSPGGLWGPGGDSLAGEEARIVKERAEAEKAMAKVVRAIEDRAKDNAEAANLVRDQDGFAGQRDEMCRDYAKEAIHGYCALRITEARTALLQARLDALPGAAARTAASEKGKKGKPKKGAKEP
jgi:hypothetical protein